MTHHTGSEVEEAHDDNEDNDIETHIGVESPLTPEELKPTDDPDAELVDLDTALDIGAAPPDERDLPDEVRDGDVAAADEVDDEPVPDLPEA